MLASLAAPFVYKLLKPAVQGLIQQHRAAAATPSSPPAAEQGGAAAGADDGQIDWEELFARSQRFGSNPAQSAAAAAAAASAREVDWSCPRSVLGIGPHAQLSAGRLQRAFRRELMLHHPDHQGPPGVGLSSSASSSSSSAGDSGGELVALSHHSTDSTEDMD
eukprot:COSAG01_NODE_7744_length_3075_cov_10.909946_2_plen_163_part_00